jgi:hypothetical protein
MLKKKCRPIFKELWKLLTKKLVLSSQKYGLGIRVPRSMGKKAPDPGPGSATLIGTVEFTWRRPSGIIQPKGTRLLHILNIIFLI